MKNLTTSTSPVTANSTKETPTPWWVYVLIAVMVVAFVLAFVNAMAVTQG